MDSNWPAQVFQPRCLCCCYLGRWWRPTNNSVSKAGNYLRNSLPRCLKRPIPYRTKRRDATDISACANLLQKRLTKIKSNHDTENAVGCLLPFRVILRWTRRPMRRRRRLRLLRLPTGRKTTSRARTAGTSLGHSSWCARHPLWSSIQSFTFGGQDCAQDDERQKPKKLNFFASFRSIFLLNFRNAREIAHRH